MKMWLLLWALLYVLFAPVSAHTEWGSVMHRVRPSLALLTFVSYRPHPLTGEMVEVPSSCTAWSIRFDGTFVSAAHCAPGRDHKVDGYDAEIMTTDKDLDILILRVPGLKKPALTFGDNPKLGQMVATYGYGYGTEDPLVLVGYIANPQHTYPEEAGEWMTLDHPFIGGMSGGPIVNESGQVVGVASQSNERTGWSRPIKDIKKALKQYR